MCLDAAWPSVDESALLRDEIELMLQVNRQITRLYFSTCHSQQTRH
jgi:hypothetical protein